MLVMADENFPGVTVGALKMRGHDVVWARTDCPGVSDKAVLERAQAEGRVVVTFDKDFGELAFRFGLPAACGVILFRLSAPSSAALTRMVVEILESRKDWHGSFAVVTEDRVRTRSLSGRN